MARAKEEPRARPAPLIPPDGRRDAPLFVVVTILVFLACLAGLASLAAWRAAGEWTSSLDASATAQILTADPDTADTQAARAAEILAGLEGVESAEALPREAAEALLEPWFGTALPEELPAPRLVAITLVPDAEMDAAGMQAALAAEGIEAELDDHGRWEAEVSGAARAAQVLSLVVVAMLVTAAGSVAVFATQAGLAAKREVIEALRVAGAGDRLIAFLFLRRFSLVGLAAGALGGMLAALAAGGLYLALSGGGLVGAPRPGWADAAVLLGAPLAAALIGALTAWVTVVAELRRS